MDTAVRSLSGVSSFLLTRALVRIGYVDDLKKNAAILERELKTLIQLRVDVMRELERAEIQGNVPINEVVGWLAETEKIAGEAIESLKGNYERRRGCGMLRPSHYKLGKKIMEISQTVAELKEKGRFDVYAVPRVPERVQPVPTANISIHSLVGQIQGLTGEIQHPMVVQEQDEQFANNFVDPSAAQTEAESSDGGIINSEQTSAAELQPSTSGSTSEMSMEQRTTSVAQTLEHIWVWLLDPNITRIGIWGKGGIGKTTIMLNIINFKLYKTNHFEVVIFVIVSRDLNMKKLRQSIGKEISLDLSEEEDERAARLLYNELRRKKFFLILDDVWERIDLEKLGVPTPTKNSGCKIALTTRKKAVCRFMETDKEILVKDLPENEAWELFCEKAGEVISPSIEATARLVCKECRGLPLAIIVVGRALRNENDKREWEHALKVLKSSKFELDGMEDDVFVPLKFSYDYLKNDTLRDCFLYCSLFPEDYPIDTDRLIGYWIMDGLIEGYENMNQAYEKGRHYLLKELIDSCLLERISEWNEIVKVHDVIRDMAVKLTSVSRERGRRFLVDAGKGLDEWQGGKNLEYKDRISLMDNDIRLLADQPNCPELSTLLLQGNDSLECVPQSFFKHMKALQVLDLSGTRIKSLPESVSELVRLRALILKECYSLRSVPPVGCLKSLWLLDLSHTRIKELPDEIGNLAQLRCLNLSYTYRLERIPTRSLSRLSLLEYLEMKESSYFGGQEARVDVIYDLGFLRHLHHVTLDVTADYNAGFLYEIFADLKKLTTFTFRIGPPDATVKTNHSKEVVKAGFPERSGRCLEFTHMADLSDDNLAKLVQYADKLFLCNHRELHTVCELRTGNLEKLRECWVSNCQNMLSVVDAKEEDIILPILEILVLYNLPSLICVFGGKIAKDSFKSLKHITLSNCPNLTTAFSSDLISKLHCLEELKLSDCRCMKQIVTGNVGRRTSCLPRLRRLELSNLRDLTNLWKGILFLPSLKEISVLNCTRLMWLPLVKGAAPVLSSIKGQQEWWRALIWESEVTKLHFQSSFTPSSAAGYYSE